MAFGEILLARYKRRGASHIIRVLMLMVMHTAARSHITRFVGLVTSASAKVTCPINLK